MHPVSRLCLAALSLCVGCASLTAPAPAARDTPGAARPERTLTAAVIRVVDGDTLVARYAGTGRRARIRVIGLDTPETVKPSTPVACFGPQASSLARELLPVGTAVPLAAEPGGDVDRYGRDLRDVWLPDGRLFAEVMISGGAGRAEAIAPQLRFASRLAADERRARQRRSGLWGRCGWRRSFPDRARSP